MLGEVGGFPRGGGGFGSSGLVTIRSPMARGPGKIPALRIRRLQVIRSTDLGPNLGEAEQYGLFSLLVVFW